jgi:hypothetical protein
VGAHNVRIVELSDHPGVMLRQARLRRTAGDTQAQRRHEDALARHRDQVAYARQARDQARAGHRWLAWLRGVLAVRRVQRQVPAAPARASVPSGREEAAAAGVQAEQSTAAALARQLGDEWTLLRGYRNRRGEIDHLLLGPDGLAAIEVKNRNGLISCTGDRWLIIRYDNYGNRVGAPEAVTDNGGRSPSEQLNQPADELAAFLRSRGHPLTIERVVWLAHRRARLGTCTGPTVRIVFSASQVLSPPGRSPALSGADRADIERLIIQDHKFNAARLAKRSAPNSQPPGRRTR